MSHFDLPHLSDHVFGAVPNCNWARDAIASRPRGLCPCRCLMLTPCKIDLCSFGTRRPLMSPFRRILTKLGSCCPMSQKEPLVALLLMATPGSAVVPVGVRRPRRAAVPRAGVHGHESEALRTLRKFTARIHQLCAQQHAQPLRRAVQRSVCELRKNFEHVPFFRLGLAVAGGEMGAAGLSSLGGPRKRCKTSALEAGC